MKTIIVFLLASLLLFVTFSSATISREKRNSILKKRMVRQAGACFGVLADAKYVCSGHGNCTGTDKCACERGWSGAQCEKPVGTPDEFPLSKALSIASTIAATWSSHENYTFTTAILRDSDSDSLYIDCNRLCARNSPNFGSWYNGKYGTSYQSQRLTCVGALGFEPLQYDGYSEPLAEEINFFIINLACDTPTYPDQLAFCLCASSSMTYPNHEETYPPYYVPPSCCNNGTYTSAPSPYTSSPVPYTSSPPPYTSAPPPYTSAPPAYTSSPQPKPSSSYYAPPSK